MEVKHEKVIGVVGASMLSISLLAGAVGVSSPVTEVQAKTVTKKAVVAPATISKGELRLKDGANLTAKHMADVKKYYGSNKITKVTVGKRSVVSTNIFKYLPSNVPVDFLAGTTVKKNVFKGEAITNPVTFNGISKIEEGAFRNATFTKDVTIEGSNAVIGKYAFMGAKLPSVKFKGTIKQIQEQAFRDTDFRKGAGIVFDSYIGEIGKYGFSTTAKTDKIVFNKGVGVVKAYGLANMNVNEIEVKGNVKQLDSDFLSKSTQKKFTVYGNIGTVKKYGLRGHNSNPTVIDVKGNITKIEDYGLGFVTLTGDPYVRPANINIDGNVGSIGRASLNGRYENIRIGGRVTNLGDYAFGYTTGKIEVVKGVENIGAYVLYTNGVRGTQEIPRNFMLGTKTIASNAFAHSHIRGEVVLPSTVVKMGNYAFYNNKIESVVDKSSLKTIPIGTFSTNEITKVDMKDTLQGIGERAFENHRISTVVLPKNLTVLGKNAFTSTQSFTVVGKKTQAMLFKPYKNVNFQIRN